MAITTDFLIVGAGVVGLCIARSLKQAYPDASVSICDKEQGVGYHASGRNSGVLHAGFYYTQDSLKAYYTQRGNQLLRAYCEARQIPVNACGKLVPANTETEQATLLTLYQRGLANGVPLQLISAAEARTIEPRVRCSYQAIYSPTTASVNPSVVMQQLYEDACREGIHFYFDHAFVRTDGGHHVSTTQQDFQVGTLINAAGLYADQVAKAYGVGLDYEILPFKGVYLLGNKEVPRLRTHIYPVPDISQPFLGVHVTLTADGGVKLGPTAMPAFWREHYQGWSRFQWRECRQIVARELSLLCHSSFNFRQLAWRELRLYSRRHLWQQADKLVTGLSASHFTQWGRSGIRAQLLDKKTRGLVNDFTVLQKDHTWHLLNAVSPAFTCAMALADDMIQRIEGKVTVQDSI